MSVKGQIVNTLGFVGEQSTSRSICRYLTGEKTNFSKCSFDKIQNVVIIVE